MTNRIFVWTLIVQLFSIGLSLGSLELSGSAVGENLGIDNPTTQSLSSHIGSALADSMAPQIAATSAGTEVAYYVESSPASTDIETLLPFNPEINPSTSVFYKGGYLGWNGFISQFPITSAGLWIERSVSWSWYATMPLRSWTRELLYVPVPSPITMYEFYPSGFVIKYYLGFAQPGYYCIWFYADTPGRHLDIFSTSSGYSNMVVIDVYPIRQPEPVPPTPFPPTPVPPTPEQQCEAIPMCYWTDGQCLCTGLLPDNPEKAACEQKPYCSWIDGQCLCTMPSTDDQERISCEQNPDCDWVNGQCLCRGLSA
jgi:hypothetical protein